MSLRRIASLCLVLCLAAVAGRGLDLPVDLGFQLGFRVRVLAGPQDCSRRLGLVVRPDQILTDKVRQITITGTIHNFSPAVCRGVEMRFAVTSYIGSGKSLGRATVEPTDIPPGGTAEFTLRLTLDDENPRDALYTVTAASPALYGKAETAAPPVLAPELTDAIVDALSE